MRKGTKRKAASKKQQEEAPSSSHDNRNGNHKPASRAKRAKTSRPQPEPEYFDDQRNLVDLWKAVFPVGTEWDQMDSVYRFNWNFSNLEDAFEEGGKLYGKKVYLFGCTEPQLVPYEGLNKIVVIPVIVAYDGCSSEVHVVKLGISGLGTFASWVVSPKPPSDQIGINSVQRESEEIIPMKKMKMDWVPYIPLENRDSQVERLKSQIFILSCTQRRSALRHLKLDRIKTYEYCLPYFKNPLKEDELEQSTELQIIFPAEPNPVVCDFDWELDEIDEFTDDMIKNEALDEDQKDAFKEYIKEQVREAKKKNRQEREARKKALEEMSEEDKAALENMRFYKFYPVQTPDTPDVSGVKSPFINRYYGKAHEVI